MKTGKQIENIHILCFYFYIPDILIIASSVSEDKFFFIQTAQFKSRLLSNTSIPYLSFMQLTITNQRSLTSSFLLEINKCTLCNPITTTTITSWHPELVVYFAQHLGNKRRVSVTKQNKTATLVITWHHISKLRLQGSKACL